ncbi:MAG TPA: hypothetical protein VEB21_11225, partial [Terriglobales bacterium]|nr:hypothetical protein [Terriglobales bacterium]
QLTTHEQSESRRKHDAGHPLGMTKDIHLGAVGVLGVPKDIHLGAVGVLGVPLGAVGVLGVPPADTVEEAGGV